MRIPYSQVAQTSSPVFDMSLELNTSKFVIEEDRFLVCAMQDVGYGQWDRIRLLIRTAYQVFMMWTRVSPFRLLLAQFKFNWFIKSRTSVEIQRRCELLLKVVEREHEQWKLLNKKKV